MNFASLGPEPLASHLAWCTFIPLCQYTMLGSEGSLGHVIPTGHPCSKMQLLLSWPTNGQWRPDITRTWEVGWGLMSLIRNPWDWEYFRGTDCPLWLTQASISRNEDMLTSLPKLTPVTAIMWCWGCCQPWALTKTAQGRTDKCTCSLTDMWHR